MLEMDRLASLATLEMDRLEMGRLASLATLEMDRLASLRARLLTPCTLQPFVSVGSG